ncbi:uncharacterized protein LOC128852688 [Cuculus canorus]|uniref:uncharacterized protein LOC128852688 n=1 Tax=Cuculus canorus TaxID=55661 RepID=UPI0023AB3217|nr:uncharacterized protein LOC128852688 [Cuculus canorus]
MGESRDTVEGSGQRVLGWESACAEESLSRTMIAECWMLQCVLLCVPSPGSCEVTGRSWCKERSPSRAGSCSWKVSQLYLLLPLDGEIRENRESLAALPGSLSPCETTLTCSAFWEPGNFRQLCPGPFIQLSLEELLPPSRLFDLFNSSSADLDSFRHTKWVKDRQQSYLRAVCFPGSQRSCWGCAMNQSSSSPWGTAAFARGIEGILLTAAPGPERKYIHWPQRSAWRLIESCLNLEHQVSIIRAI